MNVGFICFGGCSGGWNWKYPPKAPIVIRNNIFANMSSTSFYAGVDTTYFDPFGITASNVTDNYNIFYDINGKISVPLDGSTSSKVANPLFCNYPLSFELGKDSSCINAGDPTSPSDPDLTQNDIGAKYYQTPCSVSVNDIINTSDLFTVYPNPVAEILTITFQNNFFENEQIQIYNPLGMLIKEAKITQTTQINMADLLNGLYFIYPKKYPQLSLKLLSYKQKQHDRKRKTNC